MDSTATDPRDIAWLEDIRRGKHVSVPIDAFVRLVVLSGQVTAEVISGFVESALLTLPRDNSRPSANDQWRLQLSGGALFISRTGSRQYVAPAFYEIKRALPKVLTAIKGTIAGGEQSGTLTGTIRDAQGGVLSGVTVIATHNPTGATYEGVSQRDGAFTLRTVSPLPDYIITIRGLEKFFDVRGPEIPATAWAGFDLRT